VLQCVAVCCNFGTLRLHDLLYLLLFAQCVAVCCVVCCCVLLCVAVCCCVLHCLAVCCSVLHSGLHCISPSAHHCLHSVLQCVAAHDSVWQCVNVLQCVHSPLFAQCVAVCCAACCSVLQCVALRYNVLQCVHSPLSCTHTHHIDA